MVSDSCKMKGKTTHHRSHARGVPLYCDEISSPNESDDLYHFPSIREHISSSPPLEEISATPQEYICSAQHQTSSEEELEPPPPAQPQPRYFQKPRNTLGATNIVNTVDSTPLVRGSKVISLLWLQAPSNHASELSAQPFQVSAQMSW